MPAGRWAWTYRHGVPLLVASIAAVVLSGGGLVTVLALGSGGDPSGSLTSPSASAAPASADPTTGPAPTANPVDDAGCVIGRWRATAIEDVALTGVFTMIAGEPVFEYRDDGTGSIDYGVEGDGTTFQFEDTALGSGKSNNEAFGARDFDYDIVDGAIVHVYDLFSGGATLLGIPYVPNEDTFAFECAQDTMSLDGEDGSVALERLD